MNIAQIAAIGIVGAVLSLTLRKINAEASLFVGIVTGILIFFAVADRLSVVLGLLRGITDGISLKSEYITVIMRVIGIAYIAEFGSQICKDAGEGAVAAKVAFAGKVLIMGVSAPVVIGVLEMISTILP